jgi:protein-S-isoprenylcysteine O-methyltransferase Ste14
LDGSNSAPGRLSWSGAGAWLFRQRTWLPIPLGFALLAIPRPASSPTVLVIAGVGLVLLGEGLRLWAVEHIGTISRTRSDRLGPLISSGPFAHVRNPLYLGNIALWVGFALAAGLVWFVPVVIAVLALEYHAIVRWEEHLLLLRRGDEYKSYVARVPRWIPSFKPARNPATTDRYGWRHTLFSERGTLIAIAVGFLLLWIKSRL